MIWRQPGIYSTVRHSNANPLLAKFALDNEAKHTPTKGPTGPIKM
nr:hypothetical protein [Streptococcus infantis]